MHCVKGRTVQYEIVLNGCTLHARNNLLKIGLTKTPASGSLGAKR